MSARNYVWYIEVFENRGNESISNELPIENFSQITCADGKIHNLWRCLSYQQLISFQKSAKNFGFLVTPYVQEANGKIRFFSPAFRTKQRRKIAKK